MSNDSILISKCVKSETAYLIRTVLCKYIEQHPAATTTVMQAGRDRRRETKKGEERAEEDDGIKEGNHEKQLARLWPPTDPYYT